MTVRQIVLTIAMFAVVTVAPNAWSAEIVNASSGSSTVIARSTDPITEPHAQLGAVEITTDKSTPKPNNILVYVAPTENDPATDSVTYKVAGVDHAASVEIRSPMPLLSDGDDYVPSFKALFELFIVAVLLESGLALIFNWKPFLTVFDPKAVNALVAFGFAITFVFIFDFDIVGQLLHIYSGLKPGQTDWPGLILTAMIVAGGSAGVNRLFQAFGFRAPSSVITASPKPPSTVSWISITPVRKNARGDITVLLGPPGALAAVAIVAVAKSRFRPLAFMLRDRGRYPASGGHPVTPGAYEVQLTGLNEKGEPIVSTRNWGPFLVATGCLIDIELEI